MKILTLLITLSVLAGCELVGSKSPPHFAGIYVRQHADSSGYLWDTLFISPLGNSQSHLYIVRKSCGIVQIDPRKKKFAPKIFRHKLWSANYDLQEQTLLLSNGEQYVLQAEETELSNGKIAYKRIR